MRRSGGRALWVEDLWQSGAVLGGRFFWQDQRAFLAAGCHHQQQAYTHPTYNGFQIHHCSILLAMTDAEYLTHAEALLRSIESHCDRINDELDVDVDNQRVGGMITLTFSNRSQIIVNLQKPLQEVWMATKAGGYHYKFTDAWRCTREGTEFFADLSQHASAQSGQDLIFSS